MFVRQRIVIAFCIGWASQSMALEPDELFATIAPSIVVVVGYDVSVPNDSSLGSGVVVAKGTIVTNCHVIDEADSIWLKNGDHVSQAVLRFADETRDLCLVSAEEPDRFGTAIPKIGPVSALRVGQKVFAVGAPQGLELTFSDGLISSLRNIDDVGTIIQTTAPISPGSSGGGLFDDEGQLIGITTFLVQSGQNLNFAIPAVYIEAAMRREERRRIAEERRLREEELRRQREKERKASEERRKRAEEERRRLEEEQRAEKQRIEEERRISERRKNGPEGGQELFPDAYKEAASHYARGDYAAAFLAFSETAKNGDKDAQYYLGVMYSNGQGVKRDLEQSTYWFKQAARQGHALAQSSLEYRVANVNTEEETRSQEQDDEIDRLRRQLAETESELARVKREAQQPDAYQLAEEKRMDVDEERLRQEEKIAEQEKNDALILSALIEKLLQEDEATARERVRQDAWERKFPREAERFRQEKAEEEKRVTLIEDYSARISAKVRSRVLLPPEMRGNPEAIYEIVLLPGGDVFQANLKKSSGVPAYDDAVHRAIMASQPLPVPGDPNLFQRHFRRFNLSFRPK